MLGVDAQTVGASYITDCVYDAAMRCESIYSPSRKTPVDIWVSYLAVTFDIYFDCSLELIHKNGWIDQITDRIQYTNPDTHTKIQHIRQNVLNYINERIEKHDKD